MLYRYHFIIFLFEMFASFYFSDVLNAKTSDSSVFVSYYIQHVLYCCGRWKVFFGGTYHASSLALTCYVSSFWLFVVTHVHRVEMAKQ